MNKWEINQDDDEFLTDMLFETNLSIAQIAKELDRTIAHVNKRINHLGLSWVKDQRRKMSKGQSILTSVMKKLLPGEKIINEFHIGERLKLDVYCPSYQIAAEYHGRQHFYYTQRFFDSKYEFEQAQIRDAKKAERCKELGIALIVFRYNDLLNEQAVYDRMIEAIRLSKPSIEIKKKKSVTDNPVYQEAKKKNSESRKKYYRKMKEKNKNDRD